jgi:hypothetical protein
MGRCGTPVPASPNKRMTTIASSHGMRNELTRRKLVAEEEKKDL